MRIEGSYSIDQSGMLEIARGTSQNPSSQAEQHCDYEQVRSGCKVLQVGTGERRVDPLKGSRVRRSPAADSGSLPLAPRIAGGNPGHAACRRVKAGAPIVDTLAVTKTAATESRGDASFTRLVEKEARIVGIKDFSTPTLEAVDRRRSQLWTLAFAGLVCLAAGVALLTSGNAHHIGFANRLGFRVGTVVLVIALAAYVIEKERHLRRLAKLLVDERVLAAALSNRLKELAMLYEAGKAMNSVLVVDDVLQLILSSAFELLEATSGSVMLLEGSEHLVVVCEVGNASARGARVKLGEGIAGRVAIEREPVLVQGTASRRRGVKVQSAVCVPLLHRTQLLGVLNLNGATDRAYSEHDLRAVSLFAEHAAIAVANARLYESERALSAQLSEQIVRDPLTGVANRVLVTDRLTHALNRVNRTKTCLGVLFIDIDDFKLVNDECGHEVGDLTLAAVAERLSGAARPSDTVGRFGGDEFVVICEDLADDADATKIAERMLNELSRPIPTPYGERTLSASIGVATGNTSRSMSPEEFIREADQAMYRAKMEGKARVVATCVGANSDN